MKILRSIAIVLVSAAIGAGAAYWAVTEGPLAKAMPVLSVALSNPPPDVLVGNPVSIEARITGKAAKPIPLALEATVVDSIHRSLDLDSREILLQPASPPKPIALTFNNTPQTATGSYRFHVAVYELQKGGLKTIRYEGERSFLLSEPPLPPPPAPACPPCAQAPAVKQKPKPKPAPKKLGPPHLTLKISTKGEIQFGKELSFHINVVNQGQSEGSVRVELIGEPASSFAKKTSPSFLLAPAKEKLLVESYMLDPALPEGNYSFKAMAYLGNSQTPADEKSVTIEVKDKPPAAAFSEPPLKVKVGQPITLDLEAADDTGIKMVVLHIRGLEDITAPLMMPMSLTEGIKTKGIWSGKIEGIKNPGQYSFFADVEDQKGQKIRTEELTFIVSVR